MLVKEATDLFHTQLLFPAPDHDFRWFESDFRCFCEEIAGKNIVEEIIVGACEERSSPSWVCIPQKSLVISGIQTNSDELHSCMGTHNAFSIAMMIIDALPLWGLMMNTSLSCWSLVQQMAWCLFDTKPFTWVIDDLLPIELLGTNRWISARLRYLQCVSNGDTAVLH